MSRRPLLPPRAAVLPPVFAAAVTHPMVDDFSMRAARMRERVAPSIASVFSLFKRTDPMWSASNELGGEVAFAAAANSRQMVLKLEEWGVPEVWTVTLGIVYDVNESLPTSSFNIVAKLDLGAGGAVQEVEVDWKEGTVVSATMNALTVTAVYQDPPTDVPPSLRLRATVSRGTVSSARPQRSFLSSVAPAANTTALISIPKFAKSVSPIAFQAAPAIPFTNASPTDPLVRYLFLSNAEVVGSFTGAEWANFAPTGMPIPPNARFMAALNGTAVPLQFWATFDLSI